ncbi:hypothetical protein FQA39_LY15839 [Lamprigera yunnana]|nr:hypothetical protein FQA39_LY15839 [Lamprigera yunnana]
MLLLLLFCFLITSASAARVNKFTIAGLFNKDNSHAELAFKYAAQWHSIYSGEGTQYNTLVQKVPESNTFASSKIVCNMTKTSDRLIAIFGPESHRPNAIIQSICKKLEIPHIQASWQPSTNFPPIISLNFYPSAALLAEGFATIVKHMNWKSYAIVYQHDEALIRLQGILKIPETTDNPVTVRQLEDDRDYRPMFKLLKFSGVTKIILDCETDDIIEVLQQAQEVGLLNYPTSYLLISLDAHTLDYAALNTNANITMVRLFDPHNENLVVHLKNWEVGEMRSNRQVVITPQTVRTEAVLMIDAVNSLIEAVNHLNKTEMIAPRPMRCEDTDTWEGGYRIAAYMKEHRLANPISGPIVFDQFGRRTNFNLQLIELNSNLVKATWCPENGTRLNITISAKQRQQMILRSLQKQKIVVSSKLVDPYLMESNAPHTTESLSSRYEGYAVDLIELIARELNFTYVFTITESNGNYDESSGMWNGVVGDVINGVAQLGICDLTITHQRRQVVDFSNPFMTLGISILYKKPSAGETNMFAFIDPLAEDVWMYTATAYLGVSIVLYLIARMAPGDWENPHPCDENPEQLENIWNLGNALWLTMGSIMTQGCDILPKGISTRMAVSMWWFFSLLMTSSYTANLAAYLSKERSGVSINSVDDLLTQNKIKFGTLINGSTYEFFKESDYSKYQAVWNKMSGFKPSTFVGKNVEGVRKVLNKNQDYAFFMESASMEYEISKHCELAEIGDWLDSKGYGIAMPIDAPYRGEINSAILKYQESGTLQTLKKRWWKELIKKDPCELPDDDSEVKEAGLKLANVGGVFLVLGIGVTVSFLLAIAEFLWNARNIAVQERMSYWEVLALELKFAVNLWVTKKVVRVEAKQTQSREPSESKEFDEGSLFQLHSMINGISENCSNSVQT